MTEPTPPQPKRRPSFEITFSFTDFTALGDIDRDALGQALFDHLVVGDYPTPQSAWSIDGFDVVTMPTRQEPSV